MDAHPRFVRLELGARQKPHIVGRKRRHAAFPGHFHDRLDIGLLAGAPGALHLEVEAIRAQVLPTREASRRLIVPPAGECLPDVSVRTARQDDQSPQHVRLQPAALHHRRAALLALEKGAGHQLRQVPVSGEILAKKYHARRRRAFSRFANPHVDSDQRLDAGGQGLLVELHHRKQIALIGQSHRRHSEPPPRQPSVRARARSHRPGSTRCAAASGRIASHGSP